MRVFALEGNIACGKSSLIAKIENWFPNVVCIPEPVHLYTKIDQFNPLKLMYDNPLKHSFLTQIHILHEQWKFYKQNLHDSEEAEKIFLLDRSFISSLVFIDSQTELGHMDELQSKMLQQHTMDIIKDIFGQKCLKECFEGVLYLDVPPEECIVRLFQRKREEEMYMIQPYLYLKTLGKHYSSFLNEYTRVGGKVFYISESHQNINFLAEIFN